MRDPAPIADRMERLRALRNRPARDVSIAPIMHAEGRRLEKMRRATGPLAQAWMDVCPSEHLDRTAIVGVRSGVLTIRVADASTRFKLDRLLASGAGRELIRRCPVSVRRVKLVIGRVGGVEEGSGVDRRRG